MNASLENKTIRPGSLVGYSYYHSDRHRGSYPQAKAKPSQRAPRRPMSALTKKIYLTLAVLAALIFLPLLRGDSAPTKGPLNNQSKQAPAALAPATTTPAKAVNYCAHNNLDKFVRVSISQRHLWACEKSKTVYDSPVITGMLAFPETATPTGTFQISGKQTNTTLTGSDSAGAWNDPVAFWMPFLNNEHGTFGFHDAGWRTNNEFGTVDPGSNNASHGCVELPLASMQWLFQWAPVKTSLTIES